MINDYISNGSFIMPIVCCRKASADGIVRAKRADGNNGNRLTEPEYMFYLRDHLGNNRVTLRGRDGGIFQIDHYYPFGLPMGCGYYMSFQQWRFGGKEFDRTAGLDQYDFEARAYDPSTARFTRPDDLAEKYFQLSTFNYCDNNPLIKIDPTGEFWDIIWDIGNIVYDAGAAIYNHIKGDHESAKSHWKDAAFDAGAAIVPFVPAGSSKAIKITKTAIKPSKPTVPNSKEPIKVVVITSERSTSLNNSNEAIIANQGIDKSSATLNAAEHEKNASRKN